MSALRPTFELHLPYPCDLVSSRVGEELRRETGKTTHVFFGRYLELHVPASEVRLWSPHLSLYLEGDGSQTKLTGRLGPRQEIWTLVWIVYLALAFSAFFAIIYVYALWTLGQFTWFGLFPPVAMIGIGLLYLASRIGQYWSADQMTLLRQECDQLLERAFPSPHNCTPSQSDA